MPSAMEEAAPVPSTSFGLASPVGAKPPELALDYGALLGLFLGTASHIYDSLSTATSSNRSGFAGKK